MDTLDFMWRVIESQGLVATMLAYLIYQNGKEKGQLLHKICELNHFIMACLQKELDEDHNVHSSSQVKPDTAKSPDLMVERVFVSPKDNMPVD